MVYSRVPLASPQQRQVWAAYQRATQKSVSPLQQCTEKPSARCGGCRPSRNVPGQPLERHSSNDLIGLLRQGDGSHMLDDKELRPKVGDGMKG
jgi:hypothetical protein